VEIVLLIGVTTLQNETCRTAVANAVETSEVTRLGERKLLRKRTSWGPAHA